MDANQQNSLAESAQRVIADLHELAALTSTAEGAQRVAWSPVWKTAREWLKGKLSKIGLTPAADAAGNNWITLPGQSDKTVIIAGHLDSVPNGGWLDGSLGVTAALEALRRYGQGSKPRVTLKLVDWADEEGARFGRSLLGSSAFAGTHSIAADRVRTDKDGITMEDALRRCGVHMDHFPEAEKERANAAAYIELHIEQGPVLERLGLPLGVVLGTKGVERHAITFLSLIHI